MGQHDYVCKEQLHVAVQEAFRRLPPETLEMQWACKVQTPLPRSCTVPLCQSACCCLITAMGVGLACVSLALVVLYAQTQAILMQQFIDNRGEHVPPTHEAKLRLARAHGGRMGLWAAVGEYNSSFHPPAPQNR